MKFLTLLLLFSCGEDDFTQGGGAFDFEGDGVWLAASKDQGTSLYRYDSIHQRLEGPLPELAFGTDVALKGLDKNEMAVLSRTDNQAISLIKKVGRHEINIQELPFNYNINLQDILKDPKGDIWAVGYNSNLLYQLTADLKEKKTYDLSALKEGTDQYAELGTLFYDQGTQTLGVFAHRVHRKAPYTWEFKHETGLALIKQEKVASTQILPVMNPLPPIQKGNSWQILARGDFAKRTKGKSSLFSLNSSKVESTTPYDELIYSAHGDADNTVLTVWDLSGKNCIVLNDVRIFCLEGNYSLPHAVIRGNLIFAGAIKEVTTSEGKKTRENYFLILDFSGFVLREILIPGNILDLETGF